LSPNSPRTATLHFSVVGTAPFFDHLHNAGNLQLGDFGQERPQKVLKPSLSRRSLRQYRGDRMQLIGRILRELLALHEDKLGLCTRTSVFDSHAPRLALCKDKDEQVQFFGQAGQRPLSPMAEVIDTHAHLHEKAS
jgi:hypothetical protein